MVRSLWRCPMATLEIKDLSREIKIVSDTPLYVTDPVIDVLIAEVTAFEGKVSGGLSELKVEKVGPVYLYSFEAADGRTWEQTITVPATGEASMDFECDAFTELEFAPHREVRARVIALIRSHGLTLMEVTWA